MYQTHGPVLDALRVRGLSNEILDEAVRSADETGRPLRDVLIDQRVVTEIELAETLAEAYGLKSVDLVGYPIDLAAAAKIPVPLARRHRVLGIAIDDSTLAVLDLTQHVILVAAPELSAVKSAADAIEILQKLGTPDDRLTVVLNNRTPKPAVSKPAVERMLKRSVDVEVSFDGAKPDQAALTGEILSLTDPRSEITRGAQALADILEDKHGTGKHRHMQAEPRASGPVDC